MSNRFIDDRTHDLDYLLRDIRDMSDLYFVALLILNKMEDTTDNNRMISELTYLLDSKSFFNLINYFGGQTIRVPTKEEIRESLLLIRVYYHYEILGKDWKTAVEDSGIPYQSRGSLLRRYKRFVKALEDVNLPKSIKLESKEGSEVEQQGKKL